jgi:hypothetical protein
MLFYPSRTRDTLNGYKPVHFERLVGRAMLNPLYPIRHLDPRARYICDSGAFQDLGARPRLQPWQALERQLRYEEQLRWRVGDHGWHFEAMCIYDEMAGVDEAIVEGRKRKVRGTLETAERAVAETLRAAAYYDSQRHRIAGRLMFIGQGVSPRQYVEDCVLPMAELMRPGDWFGFGGFCIIGRQRSLIPVFRETFPAVLDALIPHGITRYHLLGVCVPEAVTFAAEQAARRGVALSTDSSAVELASVISGAVYVDGRKKRGPWTKAQKGIDYCPTELAHQNIVAYSDWAYALGANEAAPPTAYSCGAEWDADDLDISVAVRAGVCPVCTAPLALAAD